MSQRGMALALLLACACYKSPYQLQRDAADAYRPAEMQPAKVEPARAALRRLKIRAYADPDYQSQNVRWDSRIAAQVARASKITEARFGVALEVEVLPWERAERGGDLPGALAELIALDPGRSVDWVVGFVSSLRIFTASQEQLGLAPLFGRHFVLRGMFSVAEAMDIDQSLPLLSQAERDELGRERRLHKETLVFLHEWAHTLGAWHEDDAAHILSPLYQAKQSSFSNESAAVIRLGLQERAAPDHAAWGRDYQALARASTSISDEATRAQAIQGARALLGGESIAPAPPTSTDQAATPAAQTPVGALFADADNLLQRADARGAIAPLTRAEQALAAQPESRDWSLLAQLWLRAQVCSAAERAAAHAPASAAPVLESCARLRRWVGLSQQSALPPEREQAYAEGMLFAMRARTPSQIEDQANRAEAAFPTLPGAALLRCVARALEAPFRGAEEACAAAEAAAPQAILPHQALGQLASVRDQLPAARAELERALALDEGAEVLWVSLAGVLHRQRDAGALELLQGRHAQRFGSRIRLER